MVHRDEEPVDKSVVEQDQEQSGLKEEAQQCSWGRKIDCLRSGCPKIDGKNNVVVVTHGTLGRSTSRLETASIHDLTKSASWVLSSRED